MSTIPKHLGEPRVIDTVRKYITGFYMPDRRRVIHLGTIMWGRAFYVVIQEEHLEIDRIQGYMPSAYIEEFVPGDPYPWKKIDNKEIWEIMRYIAEDSGMIVKVKLDFEIIHDKLDLKMPTS